jgi:hypothetical protein
MHTHTHSSLSPTLRITNRKMTIGSLFKGKKMDMRTENFSSYCILERECVCVRVCVSVRVWVCVCLSERERDGRNEMICEVKEFCVCKYWAAKRGMDQVLYHLWPSSHSLSLTHTHSHTHTPTHTISLSFTHTHTHTHQVHLQFAFPLGMCSNHLRNARKYPNWIL